MLFLGFTIPQGTIRRGARCSTAKAYLLPARNRPNLHVIAFAYVTRVRIKDSNQQFLSNMRFHFFCR